MKQYLFLLLLGFVLSLPHQNSQTHGVILANTANIDQLITKDSLVLLFFSDSQCKNCEACSNAYAILSEINAEIGSFLKIYLNSENRPIFQNYKVTTFPRIIAFINGKQYKSQFQCLGSANKMYRLMHKWLQRLNNPLKQWIGQEDHSHQLIVNCTSLEQKSMWKIVQQNELWLDVYCGNKTFLGQNLAVVAQYGRVIEAWQYKSVDHNETKEKIIKLIKAYKYKFIISWNVAIAQQIFVHNQSSFVMIINNESLSQRVFGYYESIKQKWYENTDKYQPILFTVADLSSNTYQTIKLKRYLTGVDTANRKQYIYPILAFIEGGDKPNKYLLNNSSAKTKEQIENWAESIYHHIVLKQQYAQDEQKLTPWFYEDHKDHSKSDPFSLDDDSEINLVKYVKKQKDWQQLLSPNTTQLFFVYFTWRYNYQLQKLQSQLINWWNNYQNYIVKSNQVKLVVHILHTVDLPMHQGLTVDYVPSFCLINKQKKVQMMHGVTDLTKIKQFVTKTIVIQEQYTQKKFQ